MSAPQHEPVTGGCQCGSLRYTVSFRKREYPKSHTCQCTQCRKHTGTLIAPFLDMKTTQLEWSPESRSEGNPFREFSATPGVYRGFCQKCGTPLTWRSDEKPHLIEILLGTVDEKFLSQRPELTTPVGQYWCKYFIKGVTDTIPTGDLWWETRELGKKVEKS
ncbi:Mss4-like protein [Peziza echinospora]|nr:Mss4-like protein [Peziza echinospora]